MENSSFAAIQFVWASSCGALLQLIDTYFTLNNKLSDTGLSLGADVVLSLVEKGGLSSSSSFIFDNLLPLFLCLMSFQNVASEVWLLLGKIVGKMQQFHQNKQ